MTDRLAHLLQAMARHRAQVLALMLFLIAAAGFSLGHLRFSDDFRTMLPLSDPAVAEGFDTLQAIHQADRLILDVGVERDDPETLMTAAEALSQHLQTLPELTDFRGQLDLGFMKDASADLTRQLPSLLSADDLAGLESDLTAASIRERLAWIRRTLSQPQGLALQPMLQQDPLGLATPLWQRLQRLQAGLGGGQIRQGWVTSPDGRHILLTAIPRFPAADRKRSEALIRSVLSAARAVEAQFPTAALNVSVTGAHRMALDNAVLIREDTTRIGVVAVGGVALLLLGVFHRRLLALLALLPTLVGVIAGGAVLAWTGQEISLVAVGCGACLVGITVDYAIHLLYHADHAAPTDFPGLAHIVSGQAFPVLAGAATTSAGFLVMLLSPMAGHRQLGLFAAVGVVAAALFSVFVLPLLLPTRPGTGGIRPLRFVHRVEGVWLWLNRQGSWVLVAAGLVSLLAALGILRLRFSGDLTELNGITRATRADEARIREVWSQALSLTTVVVSGTNLTEVFAENEQVAEVLSAQQSRGHVVSYASSAALCPSEAVRRRNREAWDAFWTPTRRATVERAVREAGSALGYREPVLERWLQPILGASPAPASAPEGPPLLLRDQWLHEEGLWYLTTPVKVQGLDRLAALQSAVRDAVPTARLVNRAQLGERMSRAAQAGLVRYGLLVVLVNFVLLAFWFGRARLAAVTLLPIVMGVFWTLGGLGFSGASLNVANIIFMVFVAGVALDYSMFLVQARLAPRRGLPDPLAHVGGAVTTCAITTLLAVGTLALARHPALQSVGLTALLGIGSSVAATALVVPFCMTRLLRRRPEGETTATTTARKLRAVARRYTYQGAYVEQFVYWKMRTDPVFRFLDSTVPPTGHCLDLGCGFGIAAHWLTLGFPDRSVTGIDFDAAKIRAAAASAAGLGSIRFREGDVLRMAYPAADHVLLLDVLHYLPREGQAIVLDRAWKALRPGGTLVVREAFSARSRSHNWVRRCEQWAVRFGQNRSAHGLHFATRQDYEERLREAGFTDIEIHAEGGLGSNVLLTAHRGNPRTSPGGSA